MVKMDPPKLVPPGINFWISKHISLTRFGPVAYLGGLSRFLESTQARKFSSTLCTVVSFPAEPHAAFDSAYIAQLLL